MTRIAVSDSSDRRLLDDRGYGHAASMPDGLTVDQQFTLRSLAQRLDVNLYRLMSDHCGTSSLRRVRSTQLAALTKLIEREGARVAPHFERARRLAADPEFGANDETRKCIAAELACRAGVQTFRLPNDFPQVIAGYASQLEAKDAGVALQITLEIATDDGMNEETIELSSFDALRARLSAEVERVQARLDNGDYGLGGRERESAACDIALCRRSLARRRRWTIIHNNSGELDVVAEDEDGYETVLLCASWRAAYPTS